jgi:uncharacterized protein (TIGR03000 family)
MFTAVLMVAMTTTEVTPDFGRRRRGGCHGCNGGGYVAACYGGGGGGCCGGWGGGCYGGGYGGCYGGCYGSGYGVMSPGGGYPMGGGYYRMPGAGEGREMFDPRDRNRGRGRGGNEDGTNDKNRGNRDENRDEVKEPAKSRIIVTLPEDAKLTIDDQPTKSTSAQRTFISPPLEPGKNFYYNFKATIVREGRPVTTRQQVRVRAGEVTRVSIDFPKTSLTRR